MAADAYDRTIPELLRELSDEIATLVRQEMQLARAELAAKAKPVGASAASFGGAALLGLGAFGTATTFLIAVLSLAMPSWAAALLVAAVYAIAAFVLAQIGKRKLKEAAPPLLPQTTQTIKDDIEWAKTQTKSDAI